MIIELIIKHEAIKSLRNNVVNETRQGLRNPNPMIENQINLSFDLETVFAIKIIVNK